MVCFFRIRAACFIIGIPELLVLSGLNRNSCSRLLLFVFINAGLLTLSTVNILTSQGLVGVLDSSLTSSCSSSTFAAFLSFAGGLGVDRVLFEFRFLPSAGDLEMDCWDEVLYRSTGGRFSTCTFAHALSSLVFFSRINLSLHSWFLSFALCHHSSTDTLHSLSCRFYLIAEEECTWQDKHFHPSSFLANNHYHSSLSWVELNWELIN